MSQVLDVSLIDDPHEWVGWALRLSDSLHGLVAIEGEMGAGKTTAITHWLKAMGSLDRGSSPTYALGHDYVVPSIGIVHHFDFYRLDNESEAENLGLSDYFASGQPCWMEWSEKIPTLMPENVVTVSIVVLEDGARQVTLSQS